MNKSKKIPSTEDECDKLGISIINRLTDPIYERAKTDNELQTLGTVFYIMGVSLKDIMKKDLRENPNEYINNMHIDQDIKNDIKLFSKCYKK